MTGDAISTPSARPTTSRAAAGAALAALLLLAAVTGASADGLATAKTPAAEPRADAPTPPPQGDPGAPAPAPTARAEQPLGPEDLIEVSVFEIPELNRVVRVSERGSISLPLLGEMMVKGLTGMQLEDRLRTELSRKYVKNPQVSVFVKEYGSKKVSVIGAVGKPGVYEMLGPRTLLQVLAQAGGLTEDAGAELYVLRAGEGGEEQRIPVRVGDLMANRKPGLNIAIEPGDVVSVPLDRMVYVYVDGAVKTPGRIEQLASRPITLLQAIAKAGGTTDRADVKGVQVLRRSGDEPQEVIEVNLKQVRAGRQPDILLEDGDIVVVSETFF